jgi:hypothetical protein
MIEYTDCELCGRERGHWLGCEGVTISAPEPDPEPSPDPGDEPASADPDAQCGKDGCVNERLPQGKGPRPKYCADHKTRSK